MSYDELYKQFQTNVLDVTRFSIEGLPQNGRGAALSESLVEALSENVTGSGSGRGNDVRPRERRGRRGSAHATQR